MHRLSTRFSQYKLTPEEVAGVEETLKSAYVQGYLRNIQHDLASAMTQWTPDSIEDLQEYAVRMAELRGGVRVIDQILGEKRDGDLV